jgi:hypothetical protein
MRSILVEISRATSRVAGVAEPRAGPGTDIGDHALATSPRDRTRTASVKRIAGLHSASQALALWS